jgi:DNA-binding NarL/FixJ family response regulator
MSHSLTVAIVDDHSIMREAANRYLTHEGFTVILEATNGMALLDLLETCSHLPDVCLLDIEMPIMDGYETARRLKEQYPSVKILAFTLSPDARKRARILEAGADNVISKESGPDSLKSALIDTCVETR